MDTDTRYRKDTGYANTTISSFVAIRHSGLQVAIQDRIKFYSSFVSFPPPILGFSGISQSEALMSAVCVAAYPMLALALLIFGDAVYYIQAIKSRNKKSLTACLHCRNKIDPGWGHEDEVGSKVIKQQADTIGAWIRRAGLRRHQAEMRRA